MSTKVYKRVINDLIERRNRILNGEINCIPSPFPRFRETFVGVEKGKYVIVTASTKVGKTQIADYLFLYSPLFYAYNNRDKLKVKIFYFSLEMSAEEKYRQLMSHLLYILSQGKIRIDPKNLRSVNENRPLPEDVITLLQSPLYESVLSFFEEHVVILDSIRNPYGIYKWCKDYAIQNGIKHTKMYDFKDKDGNVTESKEVIDYYEPNNHKEYRIVMVDHYRLFTLEKGKDLYNTIASWSTNHAIDLRNNYNYTIIGIQQQAMSQESNENQKLNKLKPTIDGLGDCKATAQDVDLILGLYTPYRYGIREYEGYDITRFKDHIRFLEVMGGREGGGGDICPLYFDGAVNFFRELPLPNDKNSLEIIYQQVASLKIYSSIEGTVNLAIIKLNESINISKKWFWKVFKSWRNT